VVTRNLAALHDERDSNFHPSPTLSRLCQWCAPHSGRV